MPKSTGRRIAADASQLPNANDDVDAVILNNYMTILEKRSC